MATSTVLGARETRPLVAGTHKGPMDGVCGLAIPMLIGTVGGLNSFIVAVLRGPETRGKVFVPDLVVT